jgi:hypothetical protein
MASLQEVSMTARVVPNKKDTTPRPRFNARKSKGKNLAFVPSVLRGATVETPRYRQHFGMVFPDTSFLRMGNSSARIPRCPEWARTPNGTSKMAFTSSALMINAMSFLKVLWSSNKHQRDCRAVLCDGTATLAESYGVSFWIKPSSTAV